MGNDLFSIDIKFKKERLKRQLLFDFRNISLRCSFLIVVFEFFSINVFALPELENVFQIPMKQYISFTMCLRKVPEGRNIYRNRIAV